MFNSDWLLVVMPNGYGIYHCVPQEARRRATRTRARATAPTAADEKLLASLPTQERSRQDYAAAADAAVRRLAEPHGASFGGGLLKPLIGVGVLVLLLVAGGFVLLRRRQRSAIAKPPEGIEIET